jgi:hypothetical protein
MLKIAAALMTLILLGLGIWYTPPVDPLGYITFRLHNIGKFVPDYNHNIDDLKTPRPLLYADCMIMTKVLRQQVEEIALEGIIHNRSGSLNCPFEALGIVHNEYYDPNANKQKPNEDFQVYGGIFIHRPVYSFFHTRLTIVYGQTGMNSFGKRCYYNRLSGKWRLEKPCNTLWYS